MLLIPPNRHCLKGSFWNEQHFNSKTLGERLVWLSKTKLIKKQKKETINKTKAKQKKQQHNESKQTTPHPIHLGMSSNECRIPNVSICTTMSLKLALLIFSNMSSEVIHVLSNTFNFFFFPRIVDYIIIYY